MAEYARGIEDAVELHLRRLLLTDGFHETTEPAQQWDTDLGRAVAFDCPIGCRPPPEKMTTVGRSARCSLIVSIARGPRPDSGRRLA